MPQPWDNSVATVYPYLGVNHMTGAKSWGTPFTIVCTWKVDSKLRRDSNGNEFVSRDIYYTEDMRPKRYDLIVQGDSTSIVDPAGQPEAHEIRDIPKYNYTFINRVPRREMIT